MESLKHTDKRVVVRMDLDSKESHTFSGGTKIAIRRRVNNMNRRITEAVNAYVISAENIPSGAEVLVQHNASHDSHKIFNLGRISGDEAASTVKHFSIPENEVYVYRTNPMDEWTACKGFVIGLRVFCPYDGEMSGIAPEQLTNILYMTSGEYAGEVVQTLRNCDYQIVYQGAAGREESLIRCRHFEGAELNDREEIIAIRHDLTEQVKSGKLLLGFTPSDAKPLNKI